jgi:hypothetical protein
MQKTKVKGMMGVWDINGRIIVKYLGKKMLFLLTLGVLNCHVANKYLIVLIIVMGSR